MTTTTRTTRTRTTTETLTTTATGTTTRTRTTTTTRTTTRTRKAPAAAREPAVHPSPPAAPAQEADRPAEAAPVPPAPRSPRADKGAPTAPTPPWPPGPSEPDAPEQDVPEQDPADTGLYGDFEGVRIRVGSVHPRGGYVHWRSRRHVLAEGLGLDIPPAALHHPYLLTERQKPSEMGFKRTEKLIVQVREARDRGEDPAPLWARWLPAAATARKAA